MAGFLWLTRFPIALTGLCQWDGGKAEGVMERHAECSCGQLQVVCVGEPVRISVCHCLACQRRTGSAFAAQARFPRDKVAISGASKTYVRVADSGQSLTFHFCPDCGATVYYRQDHVPD